VNYSRVKLRFARGVEVFFANRVRALKQIMELAEKGMYEPLIIYGPEGCGKTALFKQAFEILVSMDYTVVYVNPIEEEEWGWRIRVSPDSKGIVEDVLGIAMGERGVVLVDLVLKILNTISKHKRLIALLADDVFQAIGLDKAEIYVKKLLNFLEYPPERLDKAVVIVGSSEGVSKTRIGRHRWASLKLMWNMSREGFKELYDQIPGEKPLFEDVWRWSGGNPGMLRKLYINGWSLDAVVDDIVVGRGLKRFVDKLTSLQRSVLEESLEDPDMLVLRLREAGTMEEKSEIQALIDNLVELNMIVDDVSVRSVHVWVDEPPVIDKTIGIGSEVAWQTPLHREAVRKVLESLPK